MAYPEFLVRVSLEAAFERVAQLRSERDELLAALKRLTLAGALSQTVHPGASAELGHSLQAAIAAIARAEEAG